MVVSKIQEQIAAYRKWLESVRHHPRVYWWETVQEFQNHWNPEAADPADMFDRCLHNSETRRLWQTEQWRPKEMLLTFWRFDARMVRAMFDDLFNETRDVEARISRFQFGLDTLLSDYRRAHPTSVDTNHYHDDYRAIALYLACRYPEQYGAPYDFEVLYATLAALGARELPQNNDVGRFFKVQRTLLTFLDKDPAVAQALLKHLNPRKHYTGKSVLLATDFCFFVAENAR